MSKSFENPKSDHLAKVEVALRLFREYHEKFGINVALVALLVGVAGFSTPSR